MRHQLIHGNAPGVRSESDRVAAQDLITGVLGAWLLLAVFVDGWAHFNRPGLETFFTPWHAALYSGLAVMGGWVALVMWRAGRAGLVRSPRPPAGYRGTVVGVVLFGLGGLLDLAWHEMFGIEVAIDALVSPTHLLLGAGGMLILGTGVRSQRAAGGRGPMTWTPPAVLSLILVTALMAFFLIYTSVFALVGPITDFTPTPEGTPGHAEAELPVIASLGGYLVTTVLLMVPVLYVLVSARRLPHLLVTLLVSTVAWLSVGVVGFPSAAVAGALGATVAALTADLVLRRLGLELLRRWLPVVTAAIATLVWAGQLAGLAVSPGLGWPVSMWSGTVVLSAATAAGLALLARSSPPLEKA